MSDLKTIQSHKDLGDLIRAMRKEQGVSQQVFADMHGLSRFTIVDAESGSGDPKFSTVMTLLSGLGLSIVATPSHLAHRISLPDPGSPKIAPQGDTQADLEDWDPEDEVSP